MRVATWNLEWAVPGTERHGGALRQLESVDADIVVTTEDSLHDWEPYPHRVDGGADWGYRFVDGRRKVIAWSRSPWSDVEVVERGACRGRFVRARTVAHGVDVQVLAVCIPWRDAHVRSGRRDRTGWDEHLEFCEELGNQIDATTAEGPTIVAGDFNQRIPRGSQPLRVAEALADCLGQVTVATSGEQQAGRLIDHIAVSRHFAVEAVQSWPNQIDGHRLTDHSGAAVEIVADRPSAAS
ncbi:endonuclease/exonuclease/phosphatase family metal-dependent hydrolase [Ilumatobacter fluminis]|uniref:Endonuclease/exonuclease/phosphatase family metal-dependent hydrolase n=1 Tax=Ilumatobacter fluminis TaxID=467091 RepID=A0A4R7HUG6_9ACTN|nr:endonuclease/exonuclease/phosphatase family protein [Ilumatobacter fluminis]TDT14607.1 endonuclease/exonuclease/phosphatase family metal-dependent hydrolase [Ilumatobacter fluminis]